jgi:hypothetical protein
MHRNEERGEGWVIYPHESQENSIYEVNCLLVFQALAQSLTLLWVNYQTFSLLW